MSTIESAAPSWTPLQPAPPKPKRPVALIVTVVALTAALLVGIPVLTVTAVGQHSAATDARAETVKVETELATTSEALDTAETDLTSTQAKVNSQANQLDACKLVVQISDHQYEQSMALIDAVSAALEMNYTRASDKVDDASDRTDSITAVMNGGGYTDLNELWAACSPTYETL